MLPAMLAERFTLTVHDETRQRPVYARVFARPDAIVPVLVIDSAARPPAN